jgi:transposase InsO family protein
VNSHKNARTTPAGRAALIRRVLEGDRVAVIAAGAAISSRTLWKWLKRYREEGEAGLVDRPSTPRRSPRAVPRHRRRQIERLRRQRWSSLSISRELKLPISTVVVVQRRLGLNRLSRLEPPRAVVRYEKDHPGELLHVDTKKLGRIAGVGHRISGIRRNHRGAVGWEHLHVCIDDRSRVSYNEVLASADGPACAGFLERALRWFRARGVEPRAVMTDNGWAYTSTAWKRIISSQRLREVKTRPYTPRTNGKAERFIQTCLREWAYARSYRSSARRTAELRKFLNFYNYERPHTALGFLPPASRLPA